MKQVSSKELFHFVCDQMEKLSKREINVQEAQAQANLAKQANNILTYEIKRAQVQMELDTHNHKYEKNIEIREVESKLFNNQNEKP